MSDVTTELAKEANDKAMEVARLQAKNDKLQNDAELLRAMLSQVQTEKRCYMAENAKLRELMRDLWEACPVDGYYCIYHCKHYDKESESHCKLEDRMRELGVDA